MYVVKRNGKHENLDANKIIVRIENLIDICPKLLLDEKDVTLICEEVIKRIRNGISTRELDQVAFNYCQSKEAFFVEYHKLAVRIKVSDLQKSVKPFTETYDIDDLDDHFIEMLDKYSDEIEQYLKPHRDYNFTVDAIVTLVNKYLWKDNDGNIIETPQYMYMRVALFLGKDRWKTTYDFLSQGYYSHATPTYYNAGHKNANLNPCFLMMNEEDSVHGMYSTVMLGALCSKDCGGLGICLDNIRSENSIIHSTNGGISDGVTPLLGVWNSTMKHINQGKRRKGAAGMYMSMWHADIENFIQAKSPFGDESLKARELFYGCWIDDIFFERVKANEDWSLFSPDDAPGLYDVWGDEFRSLYKKYEKEGLARKVMNARDLHKLLFDSVKLTSTPYSISKDNVNKKTNHAYLGTIKQSNLCVHGDTPILTLFGYYRISQCTNMKIKVWNGTEWSTTIIKKTNDNAKLMRIEFSDGSHILCTRYHKFHIQNSSGKSREVQAHDLCIGHKLIKFDFPNDAHGIDAFNYPYTHGFFCGAGTYTEGYPYPSIALSGDKQKLLPYLAVRNTSGQEDLSGKIHARLPCGLPCQFKTPSHSTLYSKLRWFEGLTDASAVISRYNGLQVISEHKRFLLDVRLLLHTMGIQSNISLNILSVAPDDLYRLIQLGYSPKHLDVECVQPIGNTKHSVRITKIIENVATDATYCFNEPNRHMGVFNGLLLGNCSEIMEYTDEETPAVCTLASIALPKYVDVEKRTIKWDVLRAVVSHVVYVMNNLINLSHYPFPAAKSANKRYRNIGIGIQGLADMLILLEFPWESAEALYINEKVQAAIYWAALDASSDCGKEFGCYEGFLESPMGNGILQFDMWNITPIEVPYGSWNDLKEKIKYYGCANSLLISNPPTATTSLILGNTENFEPITGNVYLRKTISGNFTIVNANLVSKLKPLGLWTQEIVKKIIAMDGSIQSICEIPEDIKELFKTVWELSQKRLIDFTTARAPYVCQSQSHNVYFEDITYPQWASAQLYSWEKGNKTLMYYARTRAAKKPINFSCCSG